MFVRQLVNFVMVQQDDGKQVFLKYMLSHQSSGKFGVLIEKHVVCNGSMSLTEECESNEHYTLADALKLAELCTEFKVVPSTYLEVENDLHRTAIA